MAGKIVVEFDSLYVKELCEMYLRCRHRENGREDAVRKAECVQLLPNDRGYILPERGGAVGRVLGDVVEVKGAEQVNGRVEQGNDIGPSDVAVCVRGNSGVEKDSVSIVEYSVGIGFVEMLLGPPASKRVRVVTVVRVASEEMNVIEAGGDGISTISCVVFGLNEVNLD